MGHRQADYKDRLLEIHGSNMWNGYHIQRAIEFAKQFNLTGMIFPCNDLIDRAIKPDRYFSPDVSLLSYNNRDGDTKNYKYYLKNVIDKITDAGLEFYVEEKEIYYPHEILEEFPQLRKENAAVCPTDPFWWEFLEEKIREFVCRFPKVSGIIVSAGTRESMVSLAANKCTCDRCENYSVDQWYRELISAMFRPLNQAGKKLIVRDFSYTADHQYAMVEAAAAVSPDIIMALKKVPHDYYPTFPDNPTVGNCNGMEQWIEFDTWGQYFGLGVLPCSVAEDMQGRMQRYLKKGASGVMLRTDWERLLQGSTFNSFNIFNLIAGAMLSQDVNLDLDQAYEAWLDYGLLSPLQYDSCPQEPCVPKSPQALPVLKGLMQTSWKIMEKSLYVRGHVFNRNAQMFDRYYLTYFIMTVQHTRDHWDPGASRKVQPTSENMEIMVREKEEAVAMAREIGTWLKPEELGVNGEIERYLKFVIDIYGVYTEIFRAQLKTAALIKKAENSRLPVDIQEAGNTLEVYENLAKRLDGLIEGKGYSNNVEYVMDACRVRRFQEDCQRCLKKLEE